MTKTILDPQQQVSEFRQQLQMFLDAYEKEYNLTHHDVSPLLKISSLGTSLLGDAEFMIEGTSEAMENLSCFLRNCIPVEYDRRNTLGNTAKLSFPWDEEAGKGLDRLFVAMGGSLMRGAYNKSVLQGEGAGLVNPITNTYFDRDYAIEMAVQLKQRHQAVIDKLDAMSRNPGHGQPIDRLVKAAMQESREVA